MTHFSQWDLKAIAIILMPNSPQAGSEMLNNMVASFTASNQIGEEMKKAKDS